MLVKLDQMLVKLLAINFKPSIIKMPKESSCDPFTRRDTVKLAVYDVFGGCQKRVAVTHFSTQLTTVKLGMKRSLNR